MKYKKQPGSVRLRDLGVLCVWPALAAVIVLMFDLNFLFASLLFFGLPSIYLTVRNPSAGKRCFIFAASFLFIGLLGDSYAAKDSSWQVTSMFSFRIFGLVPIEDLVWFFLTSYLILSFYEFFFDHVRHKVLGRRMPVLFAMITAAATIMLVLLLSTGQIGTITYFYLKSCVVLAIIPLATFLYEFPRFISVLLKMTAYFFSLFLITEIVGLHNGHWTFPGRHYIGKLPLGPYHIPYEELVFFLIMFCSVTIAYFELFDDNRLKLGHRH